MLGMQQLQELLGRLNPQQLEKLMIAVGLGGTALGVGGAMGYDALTEPEEEQPLFDDFTDYIGDAYDGATDYVSNLFGGGTADEEAYAAFKMASANADLIKIAEEAVLEYELMKEAGAFTEALAKGSKAIKGAATAAKNTMTGGTKKEIAARLAKAKKMKNPAWIAKEEKLLADASMKQGAANTAAAAGAAGGAAYAGSKMSASELDIFLKEATLQELIDAYGSTVGKDALIGALAGAGVGGVTSLMSDDTSLIEGLGKGALAGGTGGAAFGGIDAARDYYSKRANK